MKYLRFLLVSSLFCGSGVLYSQQNLFNVPSGDIIKQNKVFYQHQLNFYAVNEFESKSHFVYGLGKNWDIGFNLIDVPVRIGKGHIFSYNNLTISKPLYPLFLFTGQKQWNLSKSLQFNIGTQTGANISPEISGKRFASLTYGLFRLKNERGFVIGGPYVSNDVFTGGPPQWRTGYMLGYEYYITERWLLMGDFISGAHTKSQTIIGGGYNISKRLQLFVGALLAFPNRELQDGVVFELNWFNYDFKQK
jgi:hypothetical protein